jgi:hypothetical protein
VFAGVAPGATAPSLTITIKVRAAAPPGDVAYLHLLGQYANDQVDGHFDGVVAQVEVPA